MEHHRNHCCRRERRRERRERRRCCGPAPLVFGPVYAVHMLLSFAIGKSVEACKKKKQAKKVTSEETPLFGGKNSGFESDNEPGDEAPPPYVN